MTNDGDLTNKLTHPRYGHQKEYKVLIARRPDPEQIQTWRRGVVLEDGYKTAPADVYVEAGAGKGAWLRVAMGEGRKRQIREIGSLLGFAGCPHRAYPHWDSATGNSQTRRMAASDRKRS